MPTSPPPYLDEHERTIAAGADDVWTALTVAIDRSLSRPYAATYARAIGCADPVASGPRPLAEGSTIPGFRVAVAVPGSELVLEGRHRFSDYVLSFRIEAAGAGRSTLRAESRAAFPGLAGGAYRLLVVGTRGHVILVRRMLATVASRAESRTRRRRSATSR
jgi:hypothetical protein